MGELLPDETIGGYSGYCEKCRKVIKVNIQGNEISGHNCTQLIEQNKHFLDTMDLGMLGLAKYRGCIVQKLPNGMYQLWGHKNISAEDVDKYIDNSLLSLSKSIK